MRQWHYVYKYREYQLAGEREHPKPEIENG